MRIAIIGSGISGLTAASLLHDSHEINVFEANDYIGGHTHTVDVSLDDGQFSIDTGFIVYNDRTYPNFIHMLERLNVESQPTSMSFSVRCEDSNLEYNGSNFNGLFAQRRNFLRPRFYRMLNDIARFNRESLELLQSDDEDVTVGEYVSRRGYSKQFAELYLVPMGAAIWSCPPETFEKFPMRFIVEFYRNHGLLSLRNRPQWYVITGGSHCYVKPLVAPFRDRIRLSSPVAAISRNENSVTLSGPEISNESFDHVIFACHSDQALQILGDTASEAERELLGEFPYQENTVVLHTDTSVLPRRRRAWASWNYYMDDLPGRADGLSAEEPCRSATVTYNMNILQRLSSKNTFCVTLNRDQMIAPDRVLGRYIYHHPIYTTRRRLAQRRHDELINQNRTSFCGAYWGNGFHEDGVNSAMAVCKRLGVSAPWTR